MKILLCLIFSCLACVFSLRAGVSEVVPSFHIEPGDVSTAQVRLFSTALPQLYVVLNARKFPSYETFVRQNVGRAARIYVCEDLVSDLALSQSDATNEITFLLLPQKALDLARQLMEKGEKVPGDRHSID